MEFHIGDDVRVGMHVGIITDVGTVLIQVETSGGDLRMVCPWELTKAQSGWRAAAGVGASAGPEGMMGAAAHREQKSMCH